MFRYLALSFLLLGSLGSWSQTGAVNMSSEAPPGTSSVTLTLDDAIRLAKANAPQFRTALTEQGLAREDRVQARAALLPGVSYNTGAIYTEPNGTPTGVFISSNGVREYISQGVAREALSFSSVADYSLARSREALARARTEIALRGLVTTVVRDFYGAIVSQRKLRNAQQAAVEARRFVVLSQQLENGGEVAHADVIKAQLQANDRERDLQEAALAEEKARLDLAVLVFSKFMLDYQLVDDLQQTPVLPDFAHVQDLASRNNVELHAANVAVQAAQQEVSSAIAGHLPSLSINYLYGIDASQYSTQNDGIRNLGYQVSASLDVPIFNWGATQSKVRQAQLRRDLARVELTAAQRQAMANLQLFYNEAKTARAQLELLRHSADLAAESLRLVTLRYRGGEATVLEVVDAQNALVLARNNYDDGAVRYRVAIANLQAMTGAF